MILVLSKMKFTYQISKVVNTHIFLLEAHVSYTVSVEVLSITLMVDLPLTLFYSFPCRFFHVDFLVFRCIIFRTTAK